MCSRQLLGAMSTDCTTRAGTTHNIPVQENDQSRVMKCGGSLGRHHSVDDTCTASWQAVYSTVSYLDHTVRGQWLQDMGLQQRSLHQRHLKHHGERCDSACDSALVGAPAEDHEDVGVTSARMWVSSRQIMIASTRQEKRIGQGIKSGIQTSRQFITSPVARWVLGVRICVHTA